MLVFIKIIREIFGDVENVFQFCYTKMLNKSIKLI